VDLEGVFLSPQDIYILGVQEMVRGEKLSITLRIRVDRDLYSAIKLYAEKRGLDTSKAARELMRAGLERLVIKVEG